MSNSERLTSTIASTLAMSRATPREVLLSLAMTSLTFSERNKDAMGKEDAIEMGRLFETVTDSLTE